MRKTLIYVAHPFGGLEENKLKVERFIEQFQKYSDMTFVSPIHAFGNQYHAVSYEQGIDSCLSLLEKCDILLIPRFREMETSKGCLMELGFAKGAGITIIYWDELREYLEAYEVEDSSKIKAMIQDDATVAYLGKEGIDRLKEKLSRKGDLV